MIPKKAWLLTVPVVFGFIVCVAMQGNAQGPPLPRIVNIVPPSPDVPKDIAALSGKWAGAWPDGTECMLVVEEIHEKSAVVIWSWAKSPGQPPNGFTRKQCKVVTDPRVKIILDFPNRPNISLELLDPDTVEGNAIYRTGFMVPRSITMKRVN